MEHVFGFDPARGDVVTQRERLCTEPEIKGATYEKIYHVTYRVLESGDVECLKCGETFMGSAAR